MNIFAYALEFDRADQPRESVWAYELVIRSSEATIWMYCNLVAIYFACNDPGYFAAHQLPDDFIAAAYERAISLLDEAEKRFGNHPEIDTWRLHLRNRVEAVEVEESEYLRLSRANDAYLAKLLVFLSSERTEYKQEVEDMFRRASGRSTQWERYLCSFA